MSEVKAVEANAEDVVFDGLTEIYNVALSKRIGIPGSKYRTAKSELITMYGCVVPPYKQSDILAYKRLDSTYQACLDIRANTLVGLGYELRQKELTEKSELVKMLNQPNDNIGETFISILKSMFVDLDTFYNGYIEFVRYDRVRALYYMPAKDMFVRPKKNGNGNLTREVDRYVRIENSVITEFEPYPADGKTKNGVHYIIHFKRNSQENMYYGTPDNAHLFDLIKQSYLSDQYNINFFANGGQPSWAVLITGGKISKKGYEAIKEFVDGLKGVDNAHKMFFLSVPNEKANIQLLPLSKSIDEQFISLNEKTRFQIALKCHVMPKMLGISAGGNFGGGSAGVADLQLFIETVSKSEQKYIEDVLNNFFILEFGGVNAEFVLKSMDISNKKDDAIIANMFWNMVDEAGNRVLNVNEIRTRYLNLKPIDLIETPQNESGVDGEKKDGLNVSVNGKVRSSNGAIDEGKREDINNLNPEKNKR